MLWLVWIALAVGALASLLSIAFLVVRALGLWRQLKATGRAVETDVARVAGAADEAARRADKLSGRSEDMERSLARLRLSQARLAVLLAAHRDVRASVGRLTAVYPRK